MIDRLGRRRPRRRLARAPDCGRRRVGADGRRRSAARRRREDERAGARSAGCTCRAGSAAGAAQRSSSPSAAMTLDQSINPLGRRTWSVPGRGPHATPALAWLICRRRLRRSSPTGGHFADLSVGWREPSRTRPAVSYAFPRRTGTRLELGHARAVLTLASARRTRCCSDSTRPRIVIDGADHDGFMRKLLGGRRSGARSRPTLGYDSQLGFVLRGIHTPSSTDASGAEPPVDSGHRRSADDRGDACRSAAAVGPVTTCTRSCCGSRAARRTCRRAENRPDARAIDIVVQHPDRAGVPAHRPARAAAHARQRASRPEERNLRLVDLHAGAEVPARASRSTSRPGWSAGGGSILHDPDQGIYFGTLDLRVPRRVTMQAICLVATPRPDGAKGFSLIAILTVELGNPYPLGMGFFLRGLRRHARPAPHLRRGRGARGAADRSAAQRAVPGRSGASHRRDLSRAADVLPGQRGSHIFGLLVKIGWARHRRSSQFELGVALRVGRPAAADHSRPGQRDPAARRPRDPQAQHGRGRHARLRRGHVRARRRALRLQAVRPVRAHRARWRCGWAGRASAGFALAVGGLHPKFPPPAGFPSVAAAPARAHERRQPEADLSGVLRGHVEHRPVRRRAPRCTPRRTASASRATSASTC